MPSKSATFYAVKQGRAPGVYETWRECQTQVNGFSNPLFKKFHDLESAREWVGIPKRTLESDTQLPPSKRHEKTKASSSSSTSDPSVTLFPINSTSKSKASVDTPHKQMQSDTEHVVYTDGACRGNGRAGSLAGVGVWWGNNDHRYWVPVLEQTLIVAHYFAISTNNRAELIAIIRVLETAPISNTPLRIKSDSQYSIKCPHLYFSPARVEIDIDPDFWISICSGVEEWLPNWIKRNWRSSTGAPVKNVDLVMYLSTLLDLRARSGQKIILEHVRGHRGEEGNEGADVLAVAGAAYPEVQDRDWAQLMKAVEKKMSFMDGVADGVADASRAGVSESEDAPVTIVAETTETPTAGTEFLLSDEDLLEMERTGDFD
ncbi:ribonuclease H [Heterobasidion irregulare TC 32-1]|uniref:ribonuclease H n=1 Tax=Heterobasidion irregulare (strain TC 32-1) TaxID=747525 RepID=W4KDQ8_HETIT|nr:ribonuclease H [Heterobasidion irregulare TC 32-1]ETW83450.1 ribonuclease H [Heterobasidion irregulare TC 32-1]